MNEVYTAPVRSKTPGKIWEDGHIGWYTQFNQKFAQLIIEECCDYVRAIDAMEIKKHFGVEK